MGVVVLRRTRTPPAALEAARVAAVQQVRLVALELEADAWRERIPLVPQRARTDEAPEPIRERGVGDLLELVVLEVIFLVLAVAQSQREGEPFAQLVRALRERSVRVRLDRVVREIVERQGRIAGDLV